ncbi:MAG: methyltransferase domain-containing protein [Candidatus Omnitrophota bacterium]
MDLLKLPISLLDTFLSKLKGFLKSLFAVVLTPESLIKYNRACYGEDRKLKIFGVDKISDGLYDAEKEFIEKYNFKKNKCLILGCGGGREAIALAKLGIDVIGVDFVKEMVDMAMENSLRSEIRMKFVIGDFTNLFFKQFSFDLSMITSCMYGSIPTRERRISFLKEVKKALKEGAKLYISFWGMGPKDNNRFFILRKVIAFLSFGNFRYQKGDRILPSNEFHHLFNSNEEFINEVEEADFKVDSLIKDPDSNIYFAVIH